MKKIFASLLLVATVFCCGCLELNQIITIRNDGGMTVSMTYSIPAGYVPALAESQKSITGWRNSRKNSDANFDANWFLDEKAVRDFFTHPQDGITVKFYKQFTRNDRQFVEIVVDANDAAKAADLGFFGPISLQEKSMTIYIEETLHDLPPAEIQRLRTLCDGLAVKLEIVTPGKIKTTTGFKRADNHAVWHFSANGRGIDLFGKLNDIEVSWQ